MVSSPPGNLLADEVIPYNTGRAFELKQGQVIRVVGRTIVDFVAFNLHDLNERFDQARTKVYYSRLFITKGDCLLSKRNNMMLTIVEDTFSGHHDMQKGMCSRKVFEMSFRGEAKRPPQSRRLWSPKTWDDLADHGCWENLAEAVKAWDISPDDIPSPLNIYQNMRIDPETGVMWDEMLGLQEDACVDMRAEMDLLVAASHCPSGKGHTTRIQVYTR